MEFREAYPASLTLRCPRPRPHSLSCTPAGARQPPVRSRLQTPPHPRPPAQSAEEEEQQRRGRGSEPFTGSAVEWVLRKADESLDEIEENPPEYAKVIYDISTGPIGERPCRQAGSRRMDKELSSAKSWRQLMAASMARLPGLVKSPRGCCMALSRSACTSCCLLLAVRLLSASATPWPPTPLLAAPSFSVAVQARRRRRA